jgi:hypothetical protein
MYNSAEKSLGRRVSAEQTPQELPPQPMRPALCLAPPHTGPCCEGVLRPAPHLVVHVQAAHVAPVALYDVDEVVHCAVLLEQQLRHHSRGPISRQGEWGSATRLFRGVGPWADQAVWSGIGSGFSDCLGTYIV